MMSMNNLIIAVIIMSLVTFFTRIFPFLFFTNKKFPESLEFLEKYIPPVVMVVLVIYCLKDIDLKTAPFGLCELIGVAATAVLHIFIKNPLVSILGGTITYMALIRVL